MDAGKLLCTGGRDRHVIVWDLNGMKKTSGVGTGVVESVSATNFQTLLHTHGVSNLIPIWQIVLQVGIA